jgi:hypothetical protein
VPRAKSPSTILDVWLLHISLDQMRGASRLLFARGLAGESIITASAQCQHLYATICLLSHGWAGAWWAVGGLSAAAVWTTCNLVRCVSVALFFLRFKLRSCAPLLSRSVGPWETACPTLATANTLARPPAWCAYSIPKNVREGKRLQ